MTIRTAYLYLCRKIRQMTNQITSLLNHATSQGYRTNVVKPLMGMVIILLVATIALFYFGFIIPAYIIGIFSLICIICFLGCYMYCLFKNPDLLRSEKYNLEKTALEKVSITGDSVNGRLQAPQMDYVIVSSESGQMGRLGANTENGNNE